MVSLCGCSGCLTMSETASMTCDKQMRFEEAPPYRGQLDGCTTFTVLLNTGFVNTGFVIPYKPIVGMPKAFAR